MGHHHSGLRAIIAQVGEMYAHRMRPTYRLLLGGGALAAVALAACQPATPVAEKKPRRKSFEESSSWQPSAPAAAPAAAPPAANGTTDAQAQQVQQSWGAARQATTDAERQRLAGEALKQTRAMADQPSSPPQH